MAMYGAAAHRAVAHTVMNDDRLVLFLGAHKTWPIDVDWVRVWEAE